MTLTMDRTLPDYRLDEIRLDPANKTAFNVQIGELLTDGNLTLSIAEASTLVLSVDDPDKALLNSALLVRWTWGQNPDRAEAHWIKRGEKVDLTLDDLRFRLKRLEKAPDRVLNLESREWAVERLRQFRGARHIERTADGKGRALFVRMLADEAGVPWHIPELGEPQTVQHAPELTQQAERVKRNKRAARGVGTASHLKVKHVAATPEQLKNANTILDVAAELRASEKVMVAAITCATNESNLTNVHHGDAAGPDSTGLFQQRDSWGPRKVRQDPAGASRLFLKAAIKVARRFPRATIPELIAMVQFPGIASPIATHSYAGGIVLTWNARWVEESRAIVAAYGGATTKDGGTEIVVEKDFVFSRGKKENSWDAIQRLAEEVSWRAFVRKGVLWYVSDEALRKQEPALIARETEPGEPPNGIESIAIPSLDLGARDVTANITITAAVGRTAILPGMVIKTRNEGPADDVPWLVESVERPLWDDVATINCVRPTGKKDEPAAETETVTFGGTDKASEDLKAALKGTPRDVINKVVLPLARSHGINVTPASVDAANARHGPTVSGGRSDHQGPPSQAWAADMSNGSSPTKQMDALARDLGDVFGIKVSFGSASLSGGIWEGNVHGFRVQIIYRTMSGGDHTNHVHCGIRRTGTVGVIPSVPGI